MVLVDVEDAAPKSLQQVIEAGCCSSCGACEGLLGTKAKMVPGDRGRLRPKLDASITAEEEAKVLAVCPGRKVALMVEEGINWHPIVGPWLSVRKGHAADETVRFRAAAAGGLTALSCYLLSSGEVDFILHITPSRQPLEDFGPRLSYTVESLLEGCGSRYAPSTPLSSIDSVLSMGRRFAFVGKPCDVNALSNLAEVDERVNTLCAFKMSISCGQYADPPAYKKIMDEAGIKQEDVTEFRYRGHGCPGYSPYIKDKFSKEAKVDYVDFWYTPQALTYQWRCKSCPDFLGYQADITVMDCWPKGLPERIDAVTEARKHEQDGWVLTVARTRQGQDLLDRAQKAGALSMSEAAPEDVCQTQPHQVSRAVGLAARRFAHQRSSQPFPSFSEGRLQLMKAAALDKQALELVTAKAEQSDIAPEVKELIADLLPGLDETATRFHVRNFEGCCMRIKRGDPVEALPTA